MNLPTPTSRRDQTSADRLGFHRVGSEMADIFGEDVPEVTIGRNSAHRVKVVDPITFGTDGRVWVPLLITAVSLSGALFTLSILYTHGEHLPTIGGLFGKKITSPVSGPISSIPTQSSPSKGTEARPAQNVSRFELAQTSIKPKDANAERQKSAPNCSNSDRLECEAVTATRDVELAYRQAMRANVSDDVLLGYKTRWDEIAAATENKPRERAHAFNILSRNLFLETRSAEIKHTHH